MTAIRLVLFDALHTIITPRLPIHIQYAQVFESHLGQLDPLRVREGFKRALKQLQKDKPAYIGGANAWWAEVIRRTALDAGADTHRLESSLSIIVPQLMQRFSGRDGYRTFDDTIPALQTLKDNGVQTGLISNADSRMRDIIVDLGLSQFLHPILFSEEEGVEKPNPVIWERALSRAGVTASQAVHIGDELETDYWGAIRAGTHAFLLRRPGPDGEGEYRERHEDIRNIRTVDNISEMVQWVIDTNSNE